MIEYIILNLKLMKYMLKSLVY